MSKHDHAGEQRVEPLDWWALTLIVLCYAFYNLDKALVPVLIEPIKAEFRLNDTQMGLLTGLAASVPFALACIPVGILADRVNRRNLLALLVAGWSLATALTSRAASVPALFATRAGIGAFEAGFTPAALSSLSDRFPLRLRATAMGLFSLGAPIGLFMGMAMGGVVEDNYGWRTAFLVAGVPGLALAALFVMTTDEPVRGRFEVSDPGAANESLRASFAHLLRDRALRHVAIGMTWGASMLAVIAVWTPSLMRRTFELSASAGGFQSALIAGVGGGLGAAIGGILSDRVGGASQARRLVVPMAGMILSTIAGLAALLALPGPTVTMLLLGVSAFFAQFYIGSCYGVAATLAGPTRRGTAMSLLLVSFNLVSYSLGAGLIGKLSDMLASAYGPHSLRFAYACGYVFSLLALLHFWLAYREINRQSAAA